MPDISSSTGSSSTDWTHCDNVLWRFECAWRSGHRPPLLDYLTGIEGEARAYCLRELAMLDIEYQWKHGQEAFVEDYLDEFSQPDQNGDVRDQLLTEEIRARRRAGKLPTLNELKRRFPDQSDRLAAMLTSIAVEDSQEISSEGSRAADLRSNVATLRAQAQHDSGNEDSQVTSLGLREGFSFAHYVLREEVGKGAFAVVWRASDTKLDRDVAVKVLRRERLLDDLAASRMMREARAAARVQHPSIVQVYDVGQIDRCPYIVSQFIKGPTLRRAMQDRNYTQSEAADLVRRIAVGLDHAHRHGIVHRDVKPANILLTANGLPMIADFGLAHEDHGNDPTLTRAGDILGTPAFMAPEQARGDVHLIDARTDVYAVGAILYQLLTSKLIFSGGTASVINSVINDRPISPKRVDPRVDIDLDTIVLKCLEKDPQDRYHSARQLADDLQRYLDGEAIVARPASIMERLWKWSKRNPRVAVMIAGLLALTGFLLGAGIQLRAVRVQRDRARTAEVETQKLLAKSAADAGLLSMQRGQFEDAVRHFDQSLTLGAEDETDVRLKRVQALVADRRIDEAERELSAVTKLEIHDRFRGAVNLWKAQLAFERQADDEAARRFLVEADNYYLPKDEQAYVAGMLAESSPDAVDQFRAAVSLNPMHHRARRMLVTMLVSLARFDEALAEILTARQLYATDIDFALLESLVHSALGETQAANDTLAELVLSDSERESWEEFCRSVYFLTHEMDPDWHQQANRIDEVVQQYVAEHHPLLQARGIHLPPKIGEAFRNFSNHVHAYRANGDITTFRDTVATIVHAHPEGSLFVLLGELQLEDKTFKDPDDVTDALASCHASLKHGAFLGTAHISARIGIAGASLFKSVMFETDRENSIAEFREALEGIDLQLFDPTDRNMATLTMGAVRLEQWELAEKWMNRWVKALESYAPDDEATRSRRNDILWNKIVLGLRTERWLEVVQDCDVFLQENPDHPSAMGARETAIGHIRTSLNIADEEQLGDPPPRTAEPLSETE